MAYLDFVSGVHKATLRDYLARVTSHDKAECAEVALQWGEDYWDGARHHGYGGYRYDGRWRPVAEKIANHYHLPDNASILDVGCGKGYLLYEFTQVLPNASVAGIDISQYGIDNAKEEIKPFLQQGTASKLPFEDDCFDLVISFMTFHNLYNYEVWDALREVERVGRGAKYITVESYRTEREKVNLMYWQLTCRTFNTPREWEWSFEQAGYTGDYAFLYFE